MVPDSSSGTDRDKAFMIVLIWIAVGILIVAVAVTIVLWVKRRATRRHGRVPVSLIYAEPNSMTGDGRTSPKSDHRFRALSAPSNSNLDQSRGRVATVNETTFMDRHLARPDRTAPHREVSFYGGSTEQTSHSTSLKAIQDAIRLNSSGGGGCSSNKAMAAADEASTGRRQNDVYERPLPHNVATFSTFGPAGELGLTSLTPAGNDDDGGGGMHGSVMYDSSMTDGGSPGTPDGNLMMTLADDNRDRVDFYV